MLSGGVLSLMVSVLASEHAPASISLRTALAWVWLLVFGSVIGFSAYSWLLRNTRPAIALSYAYVNPIFAAVLGAAIGGEALGIATILATILIAAGILASLQRPA
jgi:drug/metabolite transporter (DMT)-like permease